MPLTIEHLTGFPSIHARFHGYNRRLWELIYLKPRFLTEANQRAWEKELEETLAAIERLLPPGEERWEEWEWEE